MQQRPPEELTKTEFALAYDPAATEYAVAVLAWAHDNKFTVTNGGELYVAALLYDLEHQA